MKKFIVILLLLFGAHCFGAATPYPGREIEMDVMIVRLDNAYAYQSQTEPTATQVSTYENYLRLGTERVLERVPTAQVKFSRQPFRWLRLTDTAKLYPASETDLDKLFDNLYIGPPPRWKYRTLVVHVVPRLPAPTLPESARYAYGTHRGMSWVFRKDEWPHEVAFAYADEPFTPSPQIFAEAFERYFFQRYGFQTATSGAASRLSADQESQLRSALMSRYGLGHFDPNMVSEIRREPGQAVFQINCSDVVAGRCHRLEYSSDLKTWTELWFTTYQVTYTDQSPLRVRVLLDKKAAFYRFVQCPDRL